MKKIINLISFVLLVAGTIFKLESWPGANLLILLGSFSMILGIAFVGYKENSQNGLTVVQNFLSSLTINCLIVGSLFKFMHWPGGQIILVSASLLALSVVLMSFIESNSIDKLSSQFIFTLLLMLFTSTSLGTKYSTKHDENQNKCEHKCNECNKQSDSTKMNLQDTLKK